MITKELLEYVRSELKKGTPYDVLRTQIIKTGWAAEDFNEAMREIHPDPTPVIKPTPVVTPVTQAAPVTPSIQSAPNVSDPITPSVSSMPVIPIASHPPITPSAPATPIVSVHVNPVVAPVTAPIIEKPQPQPAVVITPIVQPTTQAMPIVHETPIVQPLQPQQPISMQNSQMSHMPTTPPISTPSAPVIPVYTTMMPKPGKKKILFGILALIVILLIGGGVYGYVYGYFTPLSVVTSQALQASRTAKTSTFDMTINIDTSGLNKDDTSVSIPGLSLDKIGVTIKGSTDATDPNDVKFTSTASFDAGQINGVIEMRALSGTIYAELSKAPNLGFISLSPFESRWVSFPESNFSDITSTGPVGSITPINATVLNSLSQDQKDHISDLAGKAHFIIVTKRLAPEKINGVLAYHFTFDIDRAGIKQYLKDVTDYIHSVGTNNSALSAFDTTSYGDILDQVKTFNGEAWIGIRDHLPYKFLLTTGISEKDNPSAGQVKVTTAVIFNDWNKPVTIVAPSDSVPFETFLANLSGDTASTATTAPVNQVDGQKETILTNMRADAEIFYNSNKNSFTGVCTSSTRTAHGLLTDAKALPANTLYKCRSTAAAWAVSANLSSGDYYCVDSTGFVGHTPKAQLATSCTQ